MTYRLFISSVQSEFARERRMLCDYVMGDALLGHFFQPFLFEDLPALNDSAQKAYLTEAAASDVYLGIYGERYGYEDAEGVSPTEREYDTAKANGRYRIVFIKDAALRHEKEAAFIAKVEQDVVRRSFCDENSLRTAVYTALIRFLTERQVINMQPWDLSVNQKATLNDIDPEKVRFFVNTAREKRNFPIPMSAGIPAILHHLALIDEEGRLTNSALLLFAKEPQRYFITSEVKCVQFYGNRVEKPVPSYQVFKGNVFELVDQAVGFVMSRIDNAVGARTHGPQADTRFEIPLSAVTEAIVNAVVHRDYTSNGSVQVMLFRDRLEVWNPGQLPYGLTPAKLLTHHASKPINPTLAEPVYLAGYIERLGTGTEDMVASCLAAGLPQPEFRQDEDFCVTIWRKNALSSTESAPSLGENALSSEENALSSDENAPSLKLETVDGKKLTKKQIAVLKFCQTPRSSEEIFQHLGIIRQTRSYNTYITTLVLAGLLRPLAMDKMRNPNQKYVTTAGVV